MSVNARFSVVIPAYNAAPYLERAVRSVQAQTYPPLEIILVDDGSSDSTKDVAAAIRPAITVCTKKNGGCASARNHGAQLASGDWLAFLDADDAWLPSKLEKQARLAGDPRVAVVHCRAVARNGSPVPERLTFDDIWNRNDIIVSSSVVRKTVFDELGGFDDSLRWAEDLDLWFKISARGFPIVTCPEDLVEYTPTESSMSNQPEGFANSIRRCFERAATLRQVPESRLRRALGYVYEGQVRGSVHRRMMPEARKLARLALSFGVTPDRLALLVAAYTPVGVLNMVRSLKGGN